MKDLEVVLGQYSPSTKHEMKIYASELREKRIHRPRRHHNPPPSPTPSTPRAPFGHWSLIIHHRHCTYNCCLQGKALPKTVRRHQTKVGEWFSSFFLGGGGGSEQEQKHTIFKGAVVSGVRPLTIGRRPVAVLDHTAFDAIRVIGAATRDGCAVIATAGRGRHADAEALVDARRCAGAVPIDGRKYRGRRKKKKEEEAEGNCFFGLAHHGKWVFEQWGIVRYQYGQVRAQGRLGPSCFFFSHFGRSMLFYLIPKVHHSTPICGFRKPKWTRLAMKISPCIQNMLGRLLPGPSLFVKVTLRVSKLSR